MAVIAHDESKMVRVDGDVHIKSKSAQLLNPRNFGVIEPDDLPLRGQFGNEAT